MSEQNKPFVVTDRRKFTLDGEVRPDADPTPERDEREDVQASAPIEVPPPPDPTEAEPEDISDAELPALTEEQLERARAAYDATADRLDTAIRAANPGMDHPPA